MAFVKLDHPVEGAIKANETTWLLNTKKYSLSPEDKEKIDHDNIMFGLYLMERAKIQAEEERRIREQGEPGSLKNAFYQYSQRRTEEKALERFKSGL